MTSIPNTLVSHRIKQWQWKYHLINSAFFRKPMDNFVISLPPFSTAHEPTMLHHSIIHQKCMQHFCKMFTPNQKNSNHQYTLTNCTQCMDINYTTTCGNYSHHPHLSRRNIKIYYNKEANSHLVTTTSLQCYIAQLPSTPHIMKIQLQKSIFLWIWQT